MKKSTLTIALALFLVLALGAAAFAETPAAATEQEAAGTESAVLQDALDALRSARLAKRTADLEAELQSYVEAGTLTQEQADLILKNHSERQSLSGGDCDPAQCGGRGGRMHNGGHMRGNPIGVDSTQANGGHIQGAQADLQPVPENPPSV